MVDELGLSEISSTKMLFLGLANLQSRRDKMGPKKPFSERVLMEKHSHKPFSERLLMEKHSHKPFCERFLKESDDVGRTDPVCHGSVIDQQVRDSWPSRRRG